MYRAYNPLAKDFTFGIIKEEHGKKTRELE